MATSPQRDAQSPSAGRHRVPTRTGLEDARIIWPRRQLLDVWVDDLSLEALLDQLAARGGIVFTINPDHLWHLRHDAEFVQAYRTADVITADSHYLRAAMWLIGRPVVNRLPGSDILPAFCRRFADEPAMRVFLLGAKPGVAQRAREAINARAGRELVVGAHGPSMSFVQDTAEIEMVLGMIRASGANALFVGLGAPKQEMFIASIRGRLPDVRIMMGVGATLDYEAGEVRRAPTFLRLFGLEWAYRVVTEPRRYLARYIRSSRFFWWMLLDRLGRYAGPVDRPRRVPFR